MTRFIFEIDIVSKQTLGKQEVPIDVENEYAKLALQRRIIRVDGHEFIAIASVRKEGENESAGVDEAIIRAIKAREDKRQRVIAEAGQ